MNSNMGLKSTLLALSMLVAVSTPACASEQAAGASVSKTITAFMSNNKTLCGIMAVWGFLDVRLNTKNREQFKSKDLKDDVRRLLESLNIFDSAMYKQFWFMFDKYVIGLPIKFDNVDIPAEDKRSTIKGKKKMSQAPFGAYGLFDAYILSRIKSFSENVVAVAGLYVLMTNAQAFLGNATQKAAGK